LAAATHLERQQPGPGRLDLRAQRRIKAQNLSCRQYIGEQVAHDAHIHGRTDGHAALFALAINEDVLGRG
jgi:hypothetical protein